MAPPVSSCAVIELPRIKLFFGLDQRNQQHLISTAFGSPSEARDFVGSPQHALMPGAHRGRFEPPDHFVLGHLRGPLAFVCPVGRRKP